ncbi:nucleotide exchange factors-like protein [Artomyces pyxidatus]|uniref:Nucleotide exchange factors-like protein n=1 Tax=Artomyces pyxidatus TaxID=48021 RepID=A0ACB8T2M1_9AGAM|nr:nucleotide exchange factors-like protein [Artomyces pyxidatus]
MDKLLRWSIENMGKGDDPTVDRPVEPRKDLDPAILDYILGKPDAELMKEALTRARDEQLDEDERVAALDDLEMLVENIDNANDLNKLKMWPPIQELLTSSSSPNEVKMQTLWVVGTAVQNNPAAQKAYLSLDPMSSILSFLAPSVRSSQLRSKAVYTLSGLLKHNAHAVDQFEQAGGWTALRNALEGQSFPFSSPAPCRPAPCRPAPATDSDIGVRRKAAFLLNTLLTPAVAASEADARAAPSTGAALHASETQQPNPAAPPPTVHPNSHASMLSDPASVDTAPATLRAMRAHELVPALIRALASPTPHGPDGETEGDVDLEEKVVRLLYTYVDSHQGGFSEEEKRQLREFISEKESAPGEWHMLGLHSDEMQALKDAVA